MKYIVNVRCLLIVIASVGNVLFCAAEGGVGGGSSRESQSLDSFLGIPVGVCFPEGCDVISFSTNKWNSSWIHFETNRRFVRAPVQYAHVCVYKGKVYAIEASAFSRSKAKKDVFNTVNNTEDLTYDFQTTVSTVGRNAVVGGEIRQRSSGCIDSIDDDIKWATNAKGGVLSALEKRYGRKPVKVNDELYTLDFVNGKRIELKQSFTVLEIRAYDVKVALEAENAAKSDVKYGPDAF